MKHLLSFLAGVIAGIIGYTLWQHWQVWGKPVLPSERLFTDVPPPTNDEYAKWIERANKKIIEHKKSLADTQPVKVEH